MTVNEFVLFMDEQQNEERAFKTKILTWYEQVVDRTYDFFSDTLQGRSWLGLFIAFGSCVWGSLVLVCASGFRGCCFWFVGHFFSQFQYHGYGKLLCTLYRKKLPFLVVLVYDVCEREKIVGSS